MTFKLLALLISILAIYSTNPSNTVSADNNAADEMHSHLFTTALACRDSAATPTAVKESITFIFFTVTTYNNGMKAILPKTLDIDITKSTVEIFLAYCDQAKANLMSDTTIAAPIKITINTHLDNIIQHCSENKDKITAVLLKAANSNLRAQVKSAGLVVIKGVEDCSVVLNKILGAVLGIVKQLLSGQFLTILDTMQEIHTEDAFIAFVYGCNNQGLTKTIGQTFIQIGKATSNFDCANDLKILDPTATQTKAPVAIPPCVYTDA